MNLIDFSERIFIYIHWSWSQSGFIGLFLFLISLYKTLDACSFLKDIGLQSEYFKFNCNLIHKRMVG